MFFLILIHSCFCCYFICFCFFVCMLLFFFCLYVVVFFLFYFVGFFLFFFFCFCFFFVLSLHKQITLFFKKFETKTSLRKWLFQVELTLKRAGCYQSYLLTYTWPNYIHFLFIVSFILFSFLLFHSTNLYVVTMTWKTKASVLWNTP